LYNFLHVRDNNVIIIIIIIIIIWLFSKSDGGVGLDWIYLAQDRDRRQALVNAVKKIQVP